jgi:hypothetical protein
MINPIQIKFEWIEFRRRLNPILDNTFPFQRRSLHNRKLLELLDGYSLCIPYD